MALRHQQGITSKGLEDTNHCIALDARVAMLKAKVDNSSKERLLSSLVQKRELHHTKLHKQLMVRAMERRQSAQSTEGQFH